MKLNFGQMVAVIVDAPCVNSLITQSKRVQWYSRGTSPQDALNIPTYVISRFIRINSHQITQNVCQEKAIEFVVRSVGRSIQTSLC